jgi:DNA-binding transcriptional LysR family regulator
MLYNVIKQKKMALDELKLSVDELITNVKKNTGILRVLLPHAASEIYITPFLAEFILEYPNISLQLTYNAEKVDFKEDKYDIAFIDYQPTQQSQKFAKVLDFSINLYCTKEYINKYGMPSTLEEFRSHRYISMSWLGALLQKVEFIDMLTGQVELLELDNKIVISNHIQTLALIKTNEFIGPCMEFLCRNQDSLIRVLPNYRINLTNSLYLMKNPYKDSSIMDLFTSFLKKKFSEIGQIN